MLKIENKTNAQGWELEVICKDKGYLNAVVAAILKYGMISFEVEVIDYSASNESWNGRYSVFMWCSWFNNLKNITKDLAKIEKRLDKLN